MVATLSAKQSLKKRVAFQSYRLMSDKLSASVGSILNQILLLEYSIKDAQGQTQLLRIEE